MGLLERMKSLLKANLKDILQKAEDPEQALDQLIRTMEADLEEARASVATARRDERSREENLRHHLQQADVMLERATAAVRKGQDDLAREALQRRHQHQEGAAKLQRRCDADRQAMAELQSNLEGLQAKIDQARTEKHELLARQRLARARRRLQQAAGMNGGPSGAAAFDRLTERIDELEAEAAAYEDLAREDAATQIRRLGQEATTERAHVDAELQRIKERLRHEGRRGTD